jgi:hypothetical protein
VARAISQNVVDRLHSPAISGTEPERYNPIKAISGLLAGIG